MAEYIERDKIFSVWRSMPAPASVTSLSAAIHQTPTIDIVRCKDCQCFDKTGYDEDNAHEEDLSLHMGWCANWRRGTQACTFCSYGERRTDE